MIKKILSFIKNQRARWTIRTSHYFDQEWYLKNNEDVASSKIDPAIHYLKFGGFEGRDPGPDFSSNWYLQTYQDVRNARVNPLFHYLQSGRREGRSIRPSQRIVKTGFYICPVCGAKLDSFLPLNPTYLQNKQKYQNPYSFEDVETLNVDQYLCPQCHASDRDRLFALYFQKRLKDRGEDNRLRLLDFAPSKPLQKLIKTIPSLEYVSTDKYMRDVDLELDVMDLHSIASNSFDIFICSHVLEHVDDDRIALSELFRILKVGGFGILMVPINLKTQEIDEDPTISDIGERWRRFGQDDHVRLYSKQGFIQRVKDAGFVINALGVEYFGRQELIKYGITPQSVLYVVEKP